MDTYIINIVIIIDKNGTYIINIITIIDKNGYKLCCRSPSPIGNSQSTAAIKSQPTPPSMVGRH